MMVFFSLVAVSAIASLFDLKSIKRIFPALSSFIDSLPDFARRFIEGVIATAILSLWNSSLPSLLLCKKTKVERERGIWMGGG